MIKKTTAVFSLIGGLFLGSPVCAGDMGDSEYNNTFFLSLEGSYTRNTIENYSFTLLGTESALVSHKSNQLYGGRLAAGLMDKICDEFTVSGEVGWGYYGRTTLNPVPTGIFVGFPGALTIENTLTGFDVLLGAYYTQSCFNLFLKAGGLVANRNTTIDAAFNPIAFTFNNTLHINSSRTQALPVVKLGGSYLITDNWAITAAYMHAFGYNVRTVGTFDPILLTSTLNATVQNPSLNSVLVGIQFSI